MQEINFNPLLSGDGQYLACGCADKASYTMRMPVSSGRIHAFVGKPLTVFVYSVGDMYTVSGHVQDLLVIYLFSQILMKLKITLYRLQEYMYAPLSVNVPTLGREK